MTTINKLLSKIALNAVLLTGLIGQAYAADSFVVIQRGTSHIGDGQTSSRELVRHFHLPTNVNYRWQD